MGAFQICDHDAFALGRFLSNLVVQVHLRNCCCERLLFIESVISLVSWFVVD